MPDWNFLQTSYQELMGSAQRLLLFRKRRETSVRGRHDPRKDQMHDAHGAKHLDTGQVSGARGAKHPVSG